MIQAFKHDTYRACLLPVLMGLGTILSWSPAARAAHFEAGDAVTNHESLAEDAYLAAGELKALGSFGADALLAAGDAQVSGSTVGDLTVVGGELELSGPVGDDLRAAGGRIRVSSRVGGDLIVAGGKVVLTPDALIEGDCIVTGGALVIDGTIKGKLFVSGGDLKFGGTAFGLTTLRAQSVELTGQLLGPSEVGAQTIRLGEGTKLAGPFRYWSVDEIDLSGALSEGAIGRYDPGLQPSALDKAVPTDSAPWKALGRALVLAATLASLVTILLLTLVGHSKWIEVAGFRADGILPRMGRGLIYLLLVPLLLVMTLFTVVGAPLAGTLLLAWVSTVLLSGAITATFGAYWLRFLRDASWGRGLCALVAGGLYLALFALRMVPFVGWFLEFLLAATVFGAILLRLSPGREHLGAPEPA